MHQPTQRPKVLLHDHLDGGLRVPTIIELAREQSYRSLPTTDPDDLTAWFHRGADQGSLTKYLETFQHTVGVMSTPDAIRRVAFECAEDLAADGVIYAESRIAPELLATPEMSMLDVLRYIRDGFDLAGSNIEMRTIVCTMRHVPVSVAAATAAVAAVDHGVVGFDLAGAEDGHPASDHRQACDLASDAGLHLTIHAGEAAGPASISDALSCGAQRIGHGVRAAGAVSERLLADQVPLEMCPASNVHTGATAALADHPIDGCLRAGYAVTLNTDNRLMSDTSLSAEYELMRETFGWGDAEFTRAEAAAVDAAFCDDATRRWLRDQFRSSWGATPS